MRNLLFTIAIAAFAPCLRMPAQPAERLVVDAGKRGAEIRPTMFGHFFEDINYGADGGLYAEMVKNRSFEFAQPLMGWNVFGDVRLRDDGPFSRNPHYVSLVREPHHVRPTGIENEGFFGMGVVQDSSYRFTVWARGAGQRLRVEIVDPASQGETQTLATAGVDIDGGEWRRYEAVLVPTATCAKARLRILLDSEGPVDLEHVSLFPTDTWRGRENGLRKDIAQALADTRPGVFRFPGGCIVEGTDLATRYNWKHSVGPVENRPTNENRWQFSMGRRLYADYYQSYGMGFYELFLLAEDMGAEPLPVVSCGMACQFQNKEGEGCVPTDSLGPYIDDAIDLVEFANGDTTTEWGGLRARMGHPEPFGLKYLAVGNEQWGSGYPERLEAFVKALRKACPDISIVGSAGPNSEGDEFERLWSAMRRLKVDLVDEHFYRPESWFLASGSRYDGYSRKGPKVFAGEYACHREGKKRNSFYSALLEAAFLTGVERNADVVYMATYAPLLAHVEGWQWRPDLIWYDNLRMVRSCSWHVQSLYGNNRGTRVVPLTMEGRPVSGAEGQGGLFASCTWDDEAGEYIIKVVNTSDKTRSLRIDFKGLKKRAPLTAGRVTTFHSDDPDADNTLDAPDRIVPATAAIGVDASGFDARLEPLTFAVYRVK